MVTHNLAPSPSERISSADRMMSDLNQLRMIGRVGTGNSRTAFSADDLDARKWLVGRLIDAGLEVVRDPSGNIFGCPPGPEPSILIGSHIDTQPLGGWLDGAFGVIAGLELARTARETAGYPRISVVAFQDEEGRFGGLTGSRIWSGLLDAGTADEMTDATGLRFGDARRTEEADLPLGTVDPQRFSGYLETHIEQGPRLEQEGLSLGVVTSIVGVRSRTVRFIGQANHAGTTPMPLRRDAAQALFAFATDLKTRFLAISGDDTVWTLGRIQLDPNAPSVIPGEATVSVQIRDADASTLDAMTDLIPDLCNKAAEKTQTQGLVEVSGLDLDPVAMDEGWVSTLEQASASVAPGKHIRMPSGALHDAANVAQLMPTGMLFVPSIAGISHNPAEDTAVSDLRLALHVLETALLSGAHS